MCSALEELEKKAEQGGIEKRNRERNSGNDSYLQKF